MACEFSVLFPAGASRAVDAGLAALDEIDRLEARLSVFLPDSEISELNRRAAAKPVRVAEDLFDLLRLALALCRATGGAFDAATGALLRAWGFQGGMRRVPADKERLTALASSGSRWVELDQQSRTVRFSQPGVEFNLGAIGKGYAIDRATRIAASAGPALVQGGQSSLRATGAPPAEPRGWKVDLGEPVIARVHLKDRALGTSGAGNQFFESGGRKWGHILDPRTGWPASRLASVSVLARTAAEADALSTAFFVAGPEFAREFCKRHTAVGAVLVHVNGRKPRVEAVSAPEVEVLV
jgi:thiamine biosynthesis lipoprotein